MICALNEEEPVHYSLKKEKLYAVNKRHLYPISGVCEWAELLVIAARFFIVRACSRTKNDQHEEID